MATKAQSSLIDELRAQFTRLLDSVPPPTPFSATVVFNVKRAKESTFTTNADVLTDATTQLDGLKIFDYQKLKPSRRVQDRAPAVDYIIYEAWESCEFFRKQWDSKHLRHFQNSVLDLIVGPPELRFYFGSQPVTAGAPVMKTGQTQCWDSSGDSVSCKGTGQDGAIQAGMPFPEPRFGDNEDGTVTDTLTGLIWLKNADSFGEVPWQQALKNAAELRDGSHGLTDDSRPGDWRLPNIRELESLVDYDRYDPIIPAVAREMFTHVKPAIYWSSTTLAAAPTLAWMMTLGIGPAVFDLKINRNRMWPVRDGTEKSRVAQTGQKQCWDEDDAPTDYPVPGQDGANRAGVPSPEPRFLDNKDGTVTDNLTGLIWLKNASLFGFRAWDDALADCNSLASGSHGLTDGSVVGDWRLPNAREIESLVDYDRFGPCLPDKHPFMGVRPSSYWTSTSVAAAPTEAMFIILGVGPTIFENKQHPFFVWPVRDRRTV